jgi:hypothetical protein
MLRDRFGDIRKMEENTGKVLGEIGIVPEQRKCNIVIN